MKQFDLDGTQPITVRADPSAGFGAVPACGELLVHVEHGIGRFEGLEHTGLPSGTLAFSLMYSDGKLLVPVDELGLLFRIGSAEGVRLDALSSASWTGRWQEALVRIDQTARRLLRVAALRKSAHAPRLLALERAYKKFAAGLHFNPTPDQSATFDEVRADLAKTTPMDRVVYGDVGTGKTEVALRAAFIATAAGYKAAIVAPNTLLARQHYERFLERFKGAPFPILEISSLDGPKTVASAKRTLGKPGPAIVIGTHALFDETIKWRDLGLLVVDEEHRFGVGHKEALKRFSEGVHVLTLSATPIPRTLAMSLTSVRELSVINTLPPNRKPVETEVLRDLDPRMWRALRAERRRGGVSFYVCPRISDFDEVIEKIRTHAPELRVLTAHGGLKAEQLIETREKFCSGGVDVLVCTTLVEAGLDIPNANTMIIHHADRFGLAQLYQLRGRVGRAGAKAKTIFIVPDEDQLTPAAKKRIDVLQSLTAAGAGFALACQDLEMRGGGNLLGEEQSGHLRDIGLELFQLLLERAVEAINSSSPKTDWADFRIARLILDGEVGIPPKLFASDEKLVEFFWSVSRVRQSRDLGAVRKRFFGRQRLPRAIQYVFEKARLRMLCEQLGIVELRIGPRGALLKVANGANPKLLSLLRKRFGKVVKKRDGAMLIGVGAPDGHKQLRLTATILRTLGSASFGDNET